ncbi:MAG: hypothetical protein WBM37_13875 [Nitrososphaeraceae archaeon]
MSLVPTFIRRACTLHLITLYPLQVYGIILALPILLNVNTMVPQHELLMARAIQIQSNVTSTDITNMTDSLVSHAKEVNESNLELFKICTASPNLECDNAMIIIHNDCVTYPQYVATHIPSCDDSRLISYLIARELIK